MIRTVMLSLLLSSAPVARAEITVVSPTSDQKDVDLAVISSAGDFEKAIDLSAVMSGNGAGLAPPLANPSTPSGAQKIVSTIMDPETKVQIASEVHELALINRFETGEKQNYVITGRSPTNGKLEAVEKSQLFVTDPFGVDIAFDLSDMEQAKAPLKVYVLADKSGSMSGYESELVGVINGLFDGLPKSAGCKAMSFGASQDFYGDFKKPCTSKAIGLKKVEMGGGTPAFAAIETALTELAQFPGHQKIVIMLTDGAPTDLADSAGLQAMKGEAKLIFIWLGSKSASAEAEFSFIADHFIVDAGDPYTALEGYLGVLNKAIDDQYVVSLTLPPHLK